MSKKLIQDIFVKTPSADIPVNHAKTVSPEKEPQHFETAEAEEHASEESISKHSHVFIWVLCIIAVGTLLFFVSSLFATAVLTITPKSEPVALSDTYAITDSTSSVSANDLHYTVLSFVKTASQSLVTNGSQNVSQKAIGKAIIYNNYSTKSQTLAAGTRLETTAGLIYRIAASISVPGQKTVNGVKTPGSIQVTIVANAAGNQYNMTLSDLKGDFTLPDLQGTAKYSAFFGRLSVDCVGGALGSVKTVSATVLASGRTQLKNSLQNALIQQTYSQNNPATTIFKNTYFIQYTDLPDAATTSSYMIFESATIYAISFDSGELAAFIAKNKLPDYDGSAVNAAWNDDMSVAITGATKTPWLEHSLQAVFFGDATIVWSYDNAKILDEIRGQHTSILSDIASENKIAIAAISAKITPPWDTTFPTDENKITLVDTAE